MIWTILGVCYLIGALAFIGVVLLDPDVRKTPKIIAKVCFVSIIWWIAFIMYAFSGD